MTTYNLFPAGPLSVTAYDKGLPVIVATTFKVTAPAWMTQFRYFSGNGQDWDDGFREGNLWTMDADGNSTGRVVAGVTFPRPTAVDQWVTVDLPQPFALIPGQMYKTAILFPNGGYPATTHYFDGTIDYVYGVVTVPKAANLPGNMQGTFKYTPYGSDTTDGTFNNAAYYADVTITDTNPSAGQVSLKVRESGLWVAHAATPKVYSGGVWVTKSPKRWNGTTWVNL